jgi:5-methylcytosine-specific restriction endonuclease McrA
VSSTCRVCANIRSAQWKEAHPGAHKQWYDENRDWKRQYFQQWRQANAERVKQGYRTWAKANKARINALIAKRNAIKLKATPPWADHSAIRAIYKEASRLTAETGIRHEVDHVVPLRHPRVCGLHVAANMQILTSDENKRKSNQFPLTSYIPAVTIRVLRHPLNTNGCAFGDTSSEPSSASSDDTGSAGKLDEGVAAAAV